MKKLITIRVEWGVISMTTIRFVAVVAMAVLILGTMATSTNASINSQHTFYWYDDCFGGAMAFQKGDPQPILPVLVSVDEWFVDAAQTTQWYASLPVAGLPPSPFGIDPQHVVDQEMYLYQIQNVNYGSGNGFSFSNPPGNLGFNGLSGICMNQDPSMAGIPIANQFIWDSINGLDIAPAGPWQFQAFAGPGNTEWDIRANVGNGILLNQTGLLGYTVPANLTYDVLLNGWIHSWSAGAGSFKVNIANPINGFSGPKVIPAPPALILGALGLGTSLTLMRKRRML